jgi:GNAT superfamily N-acetyltransferase
MRIQLRAATTADCDLLASMNHELMVDEGSSDGIPQSQLVERMRRWLREGWRAVLIMVNKVAIGYMLFQERRDEQQVEIYIRHYFVKQMFRGKGVGQAAFALIQTEYFPAGATLALDVLATNPGARRFWERLGFESYGDNLHLEKRG